MIEVKITLAFKEEKNKVIRLKTIFYYYNDYFLSVTLIIIFVCI